MTNTTETTITINEQTYAVKQITDITWTLTGARGAVYGTYPINDKSGDLFLMKFSRRGVASRDPLGPVRLKIENGELVLI